MTTRKPKLTVTDSNLRLGARVEDVSTGFKGMLTRRLESASGFDQWCVMPPSVDNAFPEGVFLDPHTLVVIDDGIAGTLTPPDDFSRFTIGAEVKDKYSDFKGKIVTRVFEMNGCMQLVITAPKLHEGKVVMENMNANSVELVKPAKVEAARSKTGPAPQWAVTKRSNSITSRY